MLTELQERIARVILASSPDPDLALAGGAALIVRRLVDRKTVDIDLFTTRSGIDTLARQVIDVLEREGMRIHSEQVAPTFARLVVSDEGSACRVDLAQDARMAPPELGPLGLMLTTEELAADKLLALFTRAEARDYVDVHALALHLGKDRLVSLASQKDPGFDANVLAQMIGAMDRLDREEFALDDDTLGRVRTFFAQWRRELDE